jgi:hypothetical protein
MTLTVPKVDTRACEEPGDQEPGDRVDFVVAPPCSLAYAFPLRFKSYETAAAYADAQNPKLRERGSILVGVNVVIGAPIVRLFLYAVASDGAIISYHTERDAAETTAAERRLEHERERVPVGELDLIRLPEVSVEPVAAYLSPPPSGLSPGLCFPTSWLEPLTEHQMPTISDDPPRRPPREPSRRRPSRRRAGRSEKIPLSKPAKTGPVKRRKQRRKTTRRSAP